ncbi:MAG: hypothetical protein ABIH82_04505 [Candidatus Woesearchaeota archaeon]
MYMKNRKCEHSSYEESIYSKKKREILVDEGAINYEEEGFMEGYENDLEFTDEDDFLEAYENELFM